MIKLIVALDKKNGIAKNGVIPWNIKEELQFFRKETVGEGKNIIVMGRNTKDTLPAYPLKDRINIVMTSNPVGVNEVSGWNGVIELSEMCDDLYIIGGESIYKQALNVALPSRLILSRIPDDYKCDQFIDMKVLSEAYELMKSDDCKEYVIEFWQKKK